MKSQKRLPNFSLFNCLLQKTQKEHISKAVSRGHRACSMQEDHHITDESSNRAKHNTNALIISLSISILESLVKEHIRHIGNKGRWPKNYQEEENANVFGIVMRHVKGHPSSSHCQQQDISPHISWHHSTKGSLKPCPLGSLISLDGYLFIISILHLYKFNFLLKSLI